MCLDIVDREATRRYQRRREPIIAFKVVCKTSRGLVGKIMSNTVFKTGYRVNRAQVVKSADYPRAFHAYATLKGAEAAVRWRGDYYPIIRCLMWGITAVGKQNRCKVIVARKMILLTDYV